MVNLLTTILLPSKMHEGMALQEGSGFLYLVKNPQDNLANEQPVLSDPRGDVLRLLREIDHDGELARAYGVSSSDVPMHENPYVAIVTWLLEKSEFEKTDLLELPAYVDRIHHIGELRVPLKFSQRYTMYVAPYELQAGERGYLLLGFKSRWDQMPEGNLIVGQNIHQNGDEWVEEQVYQRRPAEYLLNFARQRGVKAMRIFQVDLTSGNNLSPIDGIPFVMPQQKAA